MIDEHDVNRVIELSALALDDAERGRLAGELSTILDYIARLREVDLQAEGLSSGAASTAHDQDGVRPGPAATRLRDDVPAPSLTREQVLANAPNAEAGLFRLPRLLD